MAYFVPNGELDGPNDRPRKQVLGAGHVLDDVLRIGHVAVDWCFPYERKAKEYVSTSCNDKEVESTYIKTCACK